MDIEAFRDYCLSKDGVDESFPFDNKTLVFKVMGKIFVLTDVDTFQTVNVKCEPELAISLREQYPAVLPGYHMNKQHWNTIVMDGSIGDDTIKEWIDHSYKMVVQGLPPKMRSLLALMQEKQSDF
ncbi:MAG TPA: MmcQ-like protein [Bacteroidales bacterium]|nr:MmcQ-like protein [Bacteroidales bacterium]